MDPRAAAVRREKGGREFLVGESVSAHVAGPPWHQGATVHIAWDQVSHYVVFESVDAYREAAGRYRGEQTRGKWLGKPRNR